MKINIDELSEDIRIDSYLAEIMQDLSRSRLQTIIKSGKCLVNSKEVKPSYCLRVGDIIDIDETQTVSLQILPENIPLKIIWENADMAVINKPSGMLTHPTPIVQNGTLVNALLYQYGENLSNTNGDMRRGIIHRLDRNTSGLIMIAKNNFAHDFLVNEMKEHRFCKKYLAVVRGIIEKEEFEINTPIGRHLTQPHKMAVNGKGSKEALTRVKVLERLDGATLVELTLITGRTHQIRVHMSSIGHPVYNDTLYGFGKIKIKTEEQVLQSYKLEFTPPNSCERICLEIPHDEKLIKVLTSLKN